MQFTTLTRASAKLLLVSHSNLLQLPRDIIQQIQ